MSILYFFAKIFGYVLNFLYQLIGNYGVAIILFSILVKLLTIPISIKQQRTMKKSAKIQEEMKQIQFKYKNDPEKMNQEVMALYKREKLSPFSGCFSAIVQIILLFAVFYLVRSPLTFMKKVDTNVIEKMENVVSQEGNTSNYKEIAVINYMNKLEKEPQEETEKASDEQNSESQEENKTEETKQNENTETEEKETYELLCSAIRSIQAVPDYQGKGIFYWEPEVGADLLPDQYPLGAARVNGEKNIQFTCVMNAYKDAQAEENKSNK